MSAAPLSRARSRALLVSIARVLCVLVALKILLHLSPFEPSSSPGPTKALVVASSINTEEDTEWLAHVPLDWSIYKYILGGPQDYPLSLSINRGNEAMVYLTYIIDHYEDLPDVVFFHHDHYEAWHQNFDSVSEISNLRARYVIEQGYVSTRCISGCENVIPIGIDAPVDLSLMHLVSREDQLRSMLEEFLADDEGVPEKIAAPCCGQFAASRDAIRRRSRTWWIRLRQWLIDTPLPSYNSGRLMEYTWHISLGAEAKLCSESREQCLCDVFGLGVDCDAAAD